MKYLLLTLFLVAGCGDLPYTARSIWKSIDYDRPHTLDLRNKTITNTILFYFEDGNRCVRDSVTWDGEPTKGFVEIQGLRSVHRSFDCSVYMGEWEYSINDHGVLEMCLDGDCIKYRQTGSVF